MFPCLYTSFVRFRVPGKKTPGGAGTHSQAHGHTDEPHNHPNPPPHPSDRETTESAADSTAAAPEPTAPRGRLGGRPLRTRPSAPPLHQGEPDTLTRQTTPEPRDAHIATITTAHLSHPMKLGGGDGDGNGAQAREQRGSSSPWRWGPRRSQRSTIEGHADLSQAKPLGTGAACDVPS